MQAITTIGLDIAKSVFQVHGIDATGIVVIRRQLRRRCPTLLSELPPCVVGIEACAASHHWSRELKAMGHIMRRHLRPRPGQEIRKAQSSRLARAWGRVQREGDVADRPPCSRLQDDLVS
jgi:hypothetical protein